MSDDRRQTKIDRRKINLGQPYEVAWWTKALGVTRRQLRAAVDAVGVEVKKVRAYVRLWKEGPQPVKPARKKAAKK